MVRVLIIAGILIAIVILVNYYKRSSVTNKKNIIKYSLFAAVCAALIALVATGRLNWLVAIAGTMVPLIPKVIKWMIKYISPLLYLVNKFKSQKSNKSSKSVHGQQSQVESMYLVMTLDHDTGRMEGRIIKGEFLGRSLSDMTKDELRKLMRDCDDDETISLLMAYMDRYNRREHAHDNERHNTGKVEEPAFMSIHEARKILGVEENASKDEVINAHRNLMQKMHPDRGGSEYLAVKINRAKDILLTEL
ncbi:MAG: DnaJ domain-containing protein [Gammaproteobacteria bacterium]|nr:DnaJ domain-containing protein [Gammaproteobacteria bacterium]